MICSIKFLSPEVSLHVCKSTIWPCMEYCCHVWAGASSYYLELLDKLQKQICRTVCLSLTVSREPLADHPIAASISLFYRYYFGKCSSEWLNWFTSLILRESALFSNRLHDFSVTIPSCCMDVYVNSFFPHTARCWNS